MLSDDFKSYFDSYEKRSPLSTQFPFLPRDKEALILVTNSNYPHLLDILEAECSLLGIQRPQLYIDKHSKTTKFCAAMTRYHTIIITEDACRVLDKRELRALFAHEIKHLFQAPGKTQQEMHANENDADRASVRSTSYRTCSKLLSKAFALTCKNSQTHPRNDLLRWVSGGHAAFYAHPDLAAEHSPAPTQQHPKLSDRLKAMREYELALDR